MHYIKIASDVFTSLTLCLQHFHNGSPLFNKEDAVTDTPSTHGNTIGPADELL